MIQKIKSNNINYSYKNKINRYNKVKFNKNKFKINNYTNYKNISKIKSKL